MNKFLLSVISFIFLVCCTYGQQVNTIEGRCSGDVGWTFDGQTLIITKTNPQKQLAEIPDYNVQDNPAPWVKRELPIKKVYIGLGISRIGNCAFAECKQLEMVEFYNEGYLTEIGWGAFLNCSSLFNFSIPQSVRKIGKVAFAGCSSLRSASIPSQCLVEDYAFLSCTNLNVLTISFNAVLGKGVFACEVKDGSKVEHRLYNGEIRGLPANINEDNCHIYGLSKNAVAEYLNKRHNSGVDEEMVTSEVDEEIPSSLITRNDTYALIIGNQHYRFAPDVPYARHDALVFSQYCKKTLGIPVEHVHVCEDATKAMILEQEIEDWLGKEINNKSQKRIIIYYAGHGVPDTKDHNKAYLLPTDIYGTSPERGIPLDFFYRTIGNMGFQQVTIFMDACFSGINRNNQSVNMGERGTEVEAEDTNPTTGNMIIFCAAQGNETAQGYQEEGHGLFTYYLLRELKTSSGNLTFGRLAETLESNVSKKAPSLELRKKQTPTTKASDSVGKNWRRTTF